MLIELLRKAAEAGPENHAVLSKARSVGYEECVATAEAQARGLRDRGVERFGCVIEHPADLLALLAASSASGSEACVYRYGLDDDEIDALAARFGHQIVITDGRGSLRSVTEVPLRSLATDGPAPDPPSAHPVMILTTGTTGEPKGARHDWSRLVDALKHVHEQPGARWLLTYNLNQFAGIQLLLHVVVSRATMVVPSSNQPRDAIGAMREFGVTHASATPTFWHLLTGALDERSAAEIPLKQITLGGEAARESVIERLRQLFPDARISHVYAGTEFGSALSVRDGRSGLPVSVLERDEDSDVELRIVDGELQVRSRTGMLGYYDQEDSLGEWQSTGDLVEVRDGRIHFVGRTTDVINVGGVKVHPIPVEEVVNGVRGVEIARAYGRSNPITGQVVVVDVVATPDARRDELEREIRQACKALPRAAIPRLIRFVEDVETRGQKVVRSAS